MTQATVGKTPVTARRVSFEHIGVLYSPDAGNGHLD